MNQTDECTPEGAAVDRTPAVAAPHSDDEAVDRFARVMKDKLARKRDAGRGGWETCRPEVLSRMLVEHVAKKDPIDVAIFSMMLWATHGSIVDIAATEVSGAEKAEPDPRLTKCPATADGKHREFNGWWCSECDLELGSPSGHPQAVPSTAAGA